MNLEGERRLIIINRNIYVKGIDDAYSDLKNDFLTLYFNNMKSIIIPADMIEFFAFMDGFFSQEKIVEMLLKKYCVSREEANKLISKLIAWEILEDTETSPLMSNIGKQLNMNEAKNEIQKYSIQLCVDSQEETESLKSILGEYAFESINVWDDIKACLQHMDGRSIIICSSEKKELNDYLGEVLYTRDYKRCNIKMAPNLFLGVEFPEKFKYKMEMLINSIKVKEDIIYMIFDGTAV